MLALVRDGRLDPPVTVTDVPDPVPAHGEAVVEVHASSVNRGELALLGARADGWRPGQDIAGVVVRAAADGDGPAPGTRVVGLVESGGWSELVAAPITRLATLPDGVSFTDAATLGIAGLTALRVVRAAGPVLGRSVLILGAAGGVGHFAVQLAARAGARVTAHVSTPGRGGHLNGADAVLSAAEPEQAAFDVVLDGVGGTSLERAIRAIRPGGTIVLFGATDPQPARVKLTDFFGHEGARIVTYFSYASSDVATVGPDLAVLADMVARGALRPEVATVVDWRDAAEVISGLRERRFVGKAVLTITER
ncbi:MAG TPA: zinc-binding dehydrogenase [Jatrophihabitantaceae bacterium]|nr:zinc-binding dehydrogenase [Jatrophihabitantaceae bacterium]